MNILKLLPKRDNEKSIKPICDNIFLCSEDRLIHRLKCKVSCLWPNDPNLHIRYIKQPVPYLEGCDVASP